MPSSFMRVSSASSAAAAALTVARPGYGEDTEPLQEGDLLVMAFGVGNHGVEAATLALPSGWWTIAPGVLSGAAIRVFYAFKYITDMATEPSSYTFTYTAAKAVVSSIAAYRGVLQDLNFDTITYPLGFFAPHGSGPRATATAVSQTLTSPTTNTARDFTRVVYFYLQAQAALAPIFDDIAPLIAMQSKVSVAKIGMMVADEEYEDATLVSTVHTVRANAVAEYVVLAFTLEPILDIPESYNNYKVKLLRQAVGAPYDTRMTEPIGKLCAVVGTIDNDIGGLFGAADFLPDDSLE